MIAQKNEKGLFSRAFRFWQHYQEGKAEDQNFHALIESLIDIADPAIRRASRYRKTLRVPVAEAMSYCASIIDAIPGIICLSRKQYFDDPRVKALFVKPDDLLSLLRLSPEVDRLRKTGYIGQAVALLTMTKEEKTVYGYQREGEMILQDVAQRAVNFTDHRIVAPSADFAAAKAGVVNRGLEVLATVAMEQITNLQSKAAELREKRAFLQGAIRVLGGRTRMHERFTVSDPAMAEELQKAEQALVSVEIELESVVKTMSYPEDSLRCLNEVMQKPADSLKVDCQSINLDWMNVLVGSRSDTVGHEIPLAEFSLSPALRRYAVFVTFSMD